MPILHYVGYIPKARAAQQFRVQQRAVNNWINKRTKPPRVFACAIVDGYGVVKDLTKEIIAPPGISLTSLVWVHNFGDKHKIPYERLYEDIIKDLLNGVVVADRVFINADDPKTIDYLAKFQRKRKVKEPWDMARINRVAAERLAGKR